MIVKRLGAVVPVLGLGLMLASCGGFVADHWPHFAGGEPNGLPPRPGEPGYQQFIAHGQPEQNQAQPPSAGGANAAGGQPGR